MPLEHNALTEHHRSGAKADPPTEASHCFLSLLLRKRPK